MNHDYEFERRFADQIMKCSQCGYCQAVCPVFGATLRPAYNARGKMLLLKEVLDGRLPLDRELVETLCQCTTCAGCAQNCTAGVDVPAIIKAVRRDLVRAGACHPAFEGLHQVLAENDNIYAETDPPDFDQPRNRQAAIVFFAGCVGNYREDEATEEVLNLLDRLGQDFTLIDEVCCSGVLEDVGYHVSERHARSNTERILATGARTLLSGCPYCACTFRNDPAYRELRDSGIEILVLSQFLTALDFKVTTSQRVTYHDPCDLGRHAGIYDAPRAVIAKIAPNFVELPHNRDQSLCCGSGGGLRGAYPRNSLAMARRRLEEVEAVGADVLLTDCNSCVHNLSNAKLRKQKFKIYNIAPFINQLLDAAG